MGRSQQVQDGVGGATHGNVQRHGVVKSLGSGDGARQHGLVVAVVIALDELDDGGAGLLVQRLAGGVGREHRTIARQGQANCFGQAVHGVGGEHARAGTAGGAGVLFNEVDVFIGDGFVNSIGNRVHQVQGAHRAVGQCHAAGFHGTAGDEDHGDVQAQRGHEHARGDLVAVGDADQGVGAVCVDHVLNGVGDQVAGRQ